MSMRHGNRIQYLSLATALLFFYTLGISAMNDDDLNQPLHGKTFLAPRSEAVNAARELAGWHRFINQPCKEMYGAFSITPEYKHSFRPARLAEYYFADDELVITGSQVTNRDNQTQILADYFGLPTTFQSTVRMEPEIRTGLVDFAGYFGYEDYYIRFHVPFVWTKWDFKLLETIAPTTATGSYPAGYMATASIPAPATSFTQAIAGDFTWGQVTRGLEFGRINGPQSKSGFTEAQVAVGWNFANNDYGHAGFNIRGSIPGGTPSEAVYLFETIIGNGNHPELGIGFTGHVVLWEKDGDQRISFFSDANVTHIFNARQRRSFDLRNPIDPENIFYKGFGTRYILAKQFDGNTNTYTGNSLPVIDITTLYCDTSFAIQIDAVIMATYEDPNLTADLGYNVWFRSREMISNRERIAYKTFALKGIQNTNVGPSLSNKTQSAATIFGNEFSQQAAVADPNSPVYFEDYLIDENSAATTHSFTHKVFGNISYAWIGCFPYVDPFIGIGGEVEFEGLNPRHEIKANKNSISQWGVWIKTGCGF